MYISLSLSLSLSLSIHLFTLYPYLLSNDGLMTNLNACAAAQVGSAWLQWGRGRLVTLGGALGRAGVCLEYGLIGVEGAYQVCHINHQHVSVYPTILQLCTDSARAHEVCQVCKQARPVVRIRHSSIGAVNTMVAGQDAVTMSSAEHSLSAVSRHANSCPDIFGAPVK